MAFLYETHMHTSEASACAFITGAEQAHVYFRRGYAGIIVTDHFFNGNSAVPRKLPWRERIDLFMSGYLHAKKAGGACGLDVFLGWEYNVDGQEFLTYGLGYDFLTAHPELERMSVKAYSKLVRGSGGYLAQAHPYREASYIKEYGAVKAKYIDGAEVYNAGNWQEIFNERAMAYALANGLPVQSGSDSHRGDLNFASGIVLKERAENIFDIIAAIKNGEAELITPGNA